MNLLIRRAAGAVGAHAKGRAVLVVLALAAIVSTGCRPDAPSGPATDTFAVVLEWTAPTVDANGGPLDDLAGFTVYYRAASPADGPGASQLDSGLSTRQRVGGLAAGTWYFGVKARDVAGNVSELSEELRVVVGP